MASTITKTNFDWARYLKENQDVFSTIKTGESPSEVAWNHYLSTGLKENRPAFGVGEGEVADYLQNANKESDVTKSMDATFTDLVGKMTAANDPLLAGQIPDDVRAQIEQTTAERSLSQGLGAGSAARNLTARDLGKTSLDIKNMGISNGSTIAQLSEARREFDKTFTRNISEFADTIRKTGLSQSDLEQKRVQFNATQALTVNNMIRELAIAGAELTFNYAKENISSAVFDASLKKYVDELKLLLRQ